MLQHSINQNVQLVTESSPANPANLTSSITTRNNRSCGKWSEIIFVPKIIYRGCHHPSHQTKTIIWQIAKMAWLHVFAKKKAYSCSRCISGTSRGGKDLIRLGISIFVLVPIIHVYIWLDPKKGFPSIFRIEASRSQPWFPYRLNERLCMYTYTSLLWLIHSQNPRRSMNFILGGRTLY